MTYGQRFWAVVVFIVVLCLCGFVREACADECAEVHDRDLRLACTAQSKRDAHACEEMNDHDLRILCRSAVKRLKKGDHRGN